MNTRVSRVALWVALVHYFQGFTDAYFAPRKMCFKQFSYIPVFLNLSGLSTAGAWKGHGLKD